MNILDNGIYLPNTMEFYADGKLQMISDKSFTGKDGAKVVFFENYFEVIDSKGLQQIYVLGSKVDYSAFRGKSGLLLVRLFKIPDQKKAYSVSLKDFKLN